MTYDAAGNTLTIDVTQSGYPDPSYTYDAWNRLVRVDAGLAELAVYEYDGLHHRVRIERDAPLGADPPSTGNHNEERFLFYDASWRLLEEHVTTEYIDEDWEGPGIVYFDKEMVSQTLWGNRHLDDAVMKRVDTDSNGTWDEEFYYATDAQFSTLTLFDETGTIHERVRYTAYGEARHSWGNDIDGDGDSDGTDFLILLGAWGKNVGDAGYRAEADLDRDGTIGAGDSAVFNATGNVGALADGMVSDAKDPYAGSPENAVGYAGYLFNSDEETYSVRHRTYHPDRKRWLQRDPLGAVDGSDLYNYVQNSPTILVDPKGLEKIDLAFNAFIPSDPGEVFHQPGQFRPIKLAGIFPFSYTELGFSGDERGFGTFNWMENDIPNARLATMTSFESSEFTDMFNAASTITRTAISSQYIRTISVGIFGETYSDWKLNQRRRAILKSKSHFAGNSSPCIAIISYTASGEYPFTPAILSPAIDYDVHFTLVASGNDQGEGQISVFMKAKHDLFPNYEAYTRVARDTGGFDVDNFYKYRTSGSGPGLINLNFQTTTTRNTVIKNVTIPAECCN